ncbi:protein FAM151B isoform X2 [Protopterus annectens]|uniref:protein FAM151B isoform X2 n=1 Tax=Protopterus annectens TaxID=7888 RepID=UPI001CFB93F4|nr:protein FAM151B isoform X2 [Protopterus annectens]
MTASNKTGCGSENVFDFFFEKKQIKTRDGAAIRWYHAVNSKEYLQKALKSAAHMLEADVLLGGQGSLTKEPVMAHSSSNDSDCTLREWLDAVLKTDKGIKLDFKSLEVVEPSMNVLEKVKEHLQRPVWLNADILMGPCGESPTVAAQSFIDITTSYFPDAVLSLGWTTGWHPEKTKEGYSWEMVKEMEHLCKPLKQPITFPVRAALVFQSKPQLQWLLKQSDSYSLTIWSGKEDQYCLEDLLNLRENLSKAQVFYDIFEPHLSRFLVASGMQNSC